MINRFERFSYSISMIDLYWHRLTTAEMKPLGLKGSYAVYFPRMLAHPEGITAAALSLECGRDKADVSRDMAVLLRKGLVKRGGENSYRVPLYLTGTGQELALQILEKEKKAVSLIGDTLTDEERGVFYRTMETIAARMELLCEKRLSESEGD